MPRSEVLLRPGQKFGSSFLLHVHRCSASGNSPKSEKVKGRPNGWRYVGRKEETRLKSNGRKSEWKTSSMGGEGEGKGDGHQYGRKPRTPEPISIAWKLT